MIVPTVDRGLRLVVFCSIEIAGTQPVDGIHIRPLHLVQELAGVGGKRLDIPPLPFGVDRVESQRRFPRTAQTGDHRQRIAGNFDIDILQIVLARAMHRNPVKHKDLSLMNELAYGKYRTSEPLMECIQGINNTVAKCG